MVALNQAWKRALMLGSSALVVAGVMLFFFPVPIPERLQAALPFKSTPPPPPTAFHSDLPADYSPDLSGFQPILQALWAPLKVPITASHFVAKDGEVFKVPVEPIFTKPLGKNIVILDVDTRPLEEEGEVFGEEIPKWGNLKRLSAGILAHYLYALIHGYDYRFVRAPNYEDRQGGWTKVIMTQELLKTHDYVIMMDEDAEFNNPELPLEWLFNYWNMTSEVSIAMANDPAGEPNFDSKGNVVLNTGFVINQAKAPRTAELYKAWAECPEETRFPGCAKWKREAFREQTAFSEHVRYDFMEGNVIKVLPCNEANGCPQSAGSGCVGQLVRHYWINKDAPIMGFAENVMQAFTPMLGEGFRNNVIDFREKTLVGNQILDYPPEKPEDAEAEAPAER